MTSKADHATIQFLADKGVLVSFLDNTLPSHHIRWEDEYLKIIDKAFFWMDTIQGHNFWRDLHRESKQLYND